MSVTAIARFGIGDRAKPMHMVSLSVTFAESTLLREGCDELLEDVIVFEPHERGAFLRSDGSIQLQVRKQRIVPSCRCGPP
ncbi:hypothetical protein ASD03_32110 [Ensifer sp. Root127]|nr:hypothetical protein ASD03_32110 [Ensifer sp. Root127]